MKVKDITGQQFGRLTVLYRLHNNHKKDAYWLCVCDCGNLKEVRLDHLQNGNSKSCGCLAKEITSKRSVKHKQCNTRLYKIWGSMKRRCYNVKDKRYTDYGGRGIAVCSEWRNDFMSFYNWSMANGYNDNLTIDRIDVNGNYEPSNCRWATHKQQARNRRNNKLYTLNGVTKCLAEWCEILGLNYHTINVRINVHNWSIEKALELENKNVVRSK